MNYIKLFLYKQYRKERTLWPFAYFSIFPEYFFGTVSSKDFGGQWNVMELKCKIGFKRELFHFNISCFFPSSIIISLK